MTAAAGCFKRHMMRHPGALCICSSSTEQTQPHQPPPPPPEHVGSLSWQTHFLSFHSDRHQLISEPREGVQSTVTSTAHFETHAETGSLWTFDFCQYFLRLESGPVISSSVEAISRGSARILSANKITFKMFLVRWQGQNNPINAVKQSSRSKVCI